MIAPNESLNESNATVRDPSPYVPPPRVHYPPRSSTSEQPSASLISRSLGRYPTAAVVTSVVVGITLGWLVKHKWNT